MHNPLLQLKLLLHGLSPDLYGFDFAILDTHAAAINSVDNHIAFQTVGIGHDDASVFQVYFDTYFNFRLS